MGEKIEIVLPVELLRRIDRLMELLGFSSREEFVEAAVRRLVDKYMAIAVEAP